MSWDAYFTKTVCHYEGEIVALAMEQRDQPFLVVQVKDSMGNVRLKRVAVEDVKVLPLPEYSQKTNLIIDRLGKMGVVTTCEMRDAIEEIIAKS